MCLEGVRRACCRVSGEHARTQKRALSCECKTKAAQAGGKKKSPIQSISLISVVAAQ